MDPIVCTYIIEDSGFSEPEGLALAGSMGAYWLSANKHDPLLEEWMTSGYRKHFRRAKPVAFEKLLTEIPGTVFSHNNTRLWASKLTRSEAIPKLIKRLQMSNFTFTDGGALETSTALVKVIVNESLAMSFGKAAVAAAHSTQNLSLLLESDYPELLDIWRNSGYSTLTSRGSFEVTSNPMGSVQDFGLTEVPAGSTTAQAFIINRNL